jgi:hypothetical protein
MLQLDHHQACSQTQTKSTLSGQREDDSGGEKQKEMQRGKIIDAAHRLEDKKKTQKKKERNETENHLRYTPRPKVMICPRLMSSACQGARTEHGQGWRREGSCARKQNNARMFARIFAREGAAFMHTSVAQAHLGETTNHFDIGESVALKFEQRMYLLLSNTFSVQTSRPRTLHVKWRVG